MRNLSKMRYGNCLLGALKLMLIKRTWKLRIAIRGMDFPHFYVIDLEGRRWHYRHVEDVFEIPWCFLLFKGRFTRMAYR